MSKSAAPPELRFELCSDPGRARDLARFFVNNVEPNYISHGELQGGRALDREHWASDLAHRVEAELSAVVSGKVTDGEARVVVARTWGGLAGFALISLHESGPRRYGILQDLVVDQALRQQGIGARLLAFSEQWLLERGVFRFFLESGLNNHRAHQFFERHGFETCSVTMLKELQSPAT